MIIYVGFKKCHIRSKPFPLQEAQCKYKIWYWFWFMCVWNITFCCITVAQPWNVAGIFMRIDCCCKFRWKALEISPSPNLSWCTDCQGRAAIFARHYHLFSVNGNFITRFYPLDENVILKADGQNQPNAAFLLRPMQRKRKQEQHCTFVFVFELQEQKI